MSEWVRLRRESVPAWVREQYQQYTVDIGSRDWSEYDDIPDSTEERIRFYDRIVYNPEGREFWSAMESRRDKLEEQWRGHLEIDTGFNHVELLLEMSFGLSRWVSKLERFTKTERRKSGMKLASHCAQLMSEIDQLRALVGSEYGRPKELSFALGSDATQLLKTIEAEGREWASSEPVVLRPGTKNPEQLFFIRGVADYFRHFHGADLYGAIASLTRCVYGTNVSDDTVKNII